MEENISKVDKLLICICLLVAIAFCLFIVIYHQSSVENKESTETTSEEEILSSVDESTKEPVDESYYEESVEESTSDEESYETIEENSNEEEENISDGSQESSDDCVSEDEEIRGTLDLPNEEEDTDVLEVPKNQNGFKAWMPYTALSKTSKQGRLLALAEPDENGLMKIGEYYCVALGQYYGTEIGQCYEITLSSGLVYKVVLGDCKGKKHTDAKMQYSVGCGCMCEFIVDKELLKNTPAYRSGNISSLGFDGTIISIVKLNEKIEF